MIILIFFLLFCYNNSASSKSDSTAILIPRDTSFTIFSAEAKVIKEFPNAKLVQPDIPDGIKILRNVRYLSTEGRDLFMDVCFPADREGKIFPAVILIHGGGWRSGERSQQLPMALNLAKDGYVSITIDYRLSTEKLYPAAITDIKAAIRFIRSLGKDYHIDTGKIFILGCSAGGQLAALAGVTAGNEKFKTRWMKNYSETVTGIINIDGLSDFLHPATTQNDNDPKKPSAACLWFGGNHKEKEDLWREASPVIYVNENTPPILFINSSISKYHAGRDSMISLMNKFNIYSEVHTFENSPHTFWFFEPWFTPMMKYVKEFLKKVK